ncbi:hypothetical protein [Galbibacter sp. BG1]
MSKLVSDFALLDVKDGRHDLAKHFKDRPVMGECPPEFRVPVTIEGYIQDVWGSDDGESQEFSVKVEKIETVSQKGPTDDDLLAAADTLRQRGYYVFVAHPETDFPPEHVKLDDIDEGMNIAFNEAVSMQAPEGWDDEVAA